MNGYGITPFGVQKALANTEALRKELADLDLDASVTEFVAWAVGIEQLAEHLGVIFG